MVALALDSHIRAKSKGEKSLDDVLRLAWEQYKEVGSDYAGLDEDAMAELIYDATGVAVDVELACWVDACEEPDWKKAFAQLGIKVTKTDTEPLTALGLAVSGNEQLMVRTVIEKSPAQQAGLSEGDWLVALSGIHVTKTNLEKLIKVYVGQTVSVHVIRNERLIELKLKVEKPTKDTLSLAFKD